MAAVSPIPEGFHTVTPHLVVNHAADAIEFYRQAFGAEEISRMAGPKGKLMHAEIRIGDSRVMLVDEFPDHGKRGPRPAGGSPVAIHLYVEDADAAFERAVAAGARVVTPLEDSFWGDRYGRIEDPFGHHWSIATRTEDLTREEILMRAPTMET
jgi:uncharacterized glyoxalase superfamily protein PhnB